MKRCKDCPAATDNYDGWISCVLYNEIYKPEQKACTIKFLNEQVKEWAEVRDQISLVEKIKTWIRSEDSPA